MQKILLFMALLVCAHVCATDLVPFAPPWDDTAAGPTDLRDTIAKPAGKNGFVVARDGHLYAGAERLRLFGVNFTSSANMPDHATADKIAPRMAKFGFNAIRCHFLDSTWGDVRLVDYESGDSARLNTNSLDRLDYFLARLREQGIYLDLNLLVGRKFGLNDGVSTNISQLDWKAAHAVGFFHAPLLAAQKEYARHLLTHRNPYTGLAYVDDPAVALVEINNENGLLQAWMSHQFDNLPEPFAGDLHAQWDDWLAKRYATDTALAKAWNIRNEPLGAEMLPPFSPGLRGWNVEQHGNARVQTSVADDGIASLTVQSCGSASWHVQFNHPGLRLATQGVYTFSFRAKADQSCRIQANAMQAHEPWNEVGFHADVKLAQQWRTFSYTFTATGETNSRVGFTSLNQLHTTFQFTDISLRPGGNVGMTTNESLAKKSIAVPKIAGEVALTAEGRQDWTAFLWETEQKYWREMRRFLRGELHVQTPLVGTIVGCSTPNLMAEFDVVDTHAYWQHPRFPGKTWDPSNWLVKNISMVDYPETSTLEDLALRRVAGKPHLVTEYNHPAPNVHASEGPLFLAAYAALQDWDGLFLYTYAHSENDIKSADISGFFNVCQHPTILANIPVASLLFRRGDVAIARQVLSPSLPTNREISLIAQHGRAWDVLPTEIMGVPLLCTLQHRIALDLSSAIQKPLVCETPSATNLVSDTGELAWRAVNTNQYELIESAPCTKFLIGHADGRTVALGDGVSASIGKTRNGWCTLALTLLDGDAFDKHPRHALLAATGHAENTEMGWKNKEMSTVGKDWGHAPSLVEVIPATITLPKPASGDAPTVYALNASGQRMHPVPVHVGGNFFIFDIGPEHATLWYEIVYAGK